MADHECKQEDILREIHGDVRTLVAEFKAMNGSLRETKHQFHAHKEESKTYRRKIDEAWAVIHTVKYAGGLIFGAGLVWKVVEFVAK